MHSKLTSLTLLAFLTSCTAMSQQGHGNLGVVSCSGFKGWQDCTTYALQACPNGFEIKNKEENLVWQARELTFQCKKQ